MAEKHSSANLLQAIKELLRRLFDIITLSRMHSYRPQASAVSSKDLAAQLREFIQRPSAAPSAGNEPAITQDDAVKPRQPEPSPHIENTGKHQQQTAAAGGYHVGHLPQDSVGSKLMQSAWEHLHASVRYARLGNTETARLHASIMDSSLKEAAHFLEEDVYAEFVQNLSRELNGLTEH